MVRVSFITFTRNYAKELDALLKHMADVIDEIVVVDGMSIDATRDVAESYRARVFIRRPRGFVEPDRMFAFNKVSYKFCWDSPSLNQRSVQFFGSDTGES